MDPQTTDCWDVKRKKVGDMTPEEERQFDRQEFLLNSFLNLLMISIVLVVVCLCIVFPLPSIAIGVLAILIVLLGRG